MSVFPLSSGKTFQILFVMICVLSPYMNQSLCLRNAVVLYLPMFVTECICQNLKQVLSVNNMF